MPELREATNRSKRRVATVAVGAGIVIALLLWGCIAYVKAENLRQVRERAHEAAVMREVNRICGSGPKHVDRHGTGWSNGPYWVVTCVDGSVRVVPE